MSKLIVFTDGGARGNPGRAAIGVAIKTEENINLFQISRKIGQTTNNVAEYSAVIAGLTWIKNNYPIVKLSLPCRLASLRSGQAGNCQMIQFYLDSTLVVNQLNGIFKVKDSDLRNLLVKIRQLEQEVGGNVMYTAIPREKNREADALVNNALDGL